MHTCNVQREVWRPALFGVALVLLAGCQQEMARQPSFRPLRPSGFFADNASARPLVPGTVARGQLRTDRHLYEGMRDREPQEAVRLASLVAGAAGGNGVAALDPNLDVRPYANTFPFAVDEKVLARGRQRFDIYCAVCHDRAGHGLGMIVRRGFTRPPSFHTDLARGYALRGETMKLRDAPVGYYFHVITVGFGAMPDYASQVPVRDRWAIVAYIKALQVSQGTKLAELDDATRAKFAGGKR